MSSQASPTLTQEEIAEAAGGDSSTGEIKDFSFKLSPMLVKELRQGLRSKIFAIAFIVLQAGMILFTLFSAADTSGADGGGFFWFFTCCALLIVMPMRATEALGAELSSGTMELLFLTRLSAFRIAFGKWIAIFSQTLLLVVSILPYLILRYYLGGINLLDELSTLAILVLLSAVLTAALIGFSASTHPIVRIIRVFAAVAGAVFLVIFLLNVAFSRAFGGGGIWGSTVVSPWYIILGALVFGIYFVYAFLDLGASRIAPLGSNHSTRKRLMGLVALGLVFLFTWLGMGWVLGATLGCFIAIPLGVEALTEYPTLTRGIMRPFVHGKLSSLRRIGTHFLAPGWHTGVFFFFILAGIATLYLWCFPHQDLVARSSGSSRDLVDLWAPFLCALAALLYPLLLIRIFFRQSANSFLLYFVIQLCQFLVFFLLIFIVESRTMPRTDWAYPFAGVFPLAGLFLGMSDSGHWEEILFVTMIVMGITILVCLFTGIGLHSRMSKLFGLMSKQKKAGGGKADGDEIVEEELSA